MESSITSTSLSSNISEDSSFFSGTYSVDMSVDASSVRVNLVLVERVFAIFSHLEIFCIIF